MTKLNWDNLTRDERVEYMRLQMSPSGCTRSAYLPDDCGDCNACGSPAFGYDWCDECLNRHQVLRHKLEGKC